MIAGEWEEKIPAGISPAGVLLVGDRAQDRVKAQENSKEKSPTMSFKILAGFDDAQPRARAA
jgi:hypothetical protein